MIKRALVAVTAGALGIGLAATVPGAASATVPTASPVRSSAAAIARVHWKTCDDATLTSYGLQCGSVKVPLDYAHPGGRKITLKLTRAKHHPSAGKYLGLMLTNPGGPGGSGLTLPVLQGYVPKKVGFRYDWIGFDPRGVGTSTPALQCTTTAADYDRPPYIPTNGTLMHYWRTRSKDFSKACGRSTAKRLLSHMTTADNARDMNSIRQALGAKKISYYGFSWGSYLGQDFLTMFPHRVKRVVLDGVVNPSRVWYGANLDQDRQFDKNMNVFWKWMSHHNDAFGLGTSWKAIKADFYNERAKLAKTPAAGGKLGPDELTDAMLDAGYYVYGWVDDGTAFADLVKNNDGSKLLAAYAEGNVGKAANNGFAVYNAVQCTDNPWPGWAKTKADSWRVNKTAPFETWGNTWYNAPCLTWPVKSQHRLYVHQKAGVPPFLLINETQDAATPYTGALAVRSRFSKARLIAGVGGTTHAGSLSGVSCVDDRIATYLSTGKVPARVSGRRADVRCGYVPRPNPSSTSDRTQARDQMPSIVRRALQNAQRFELG